MTSCCGSSRRTGSAVRYSDGYRGLPRYAPARRCVQVLQGFTNRHGFNVPEGLQEAGLETRYGQAMASAQDVYAKLAMSHPESAQYALPLGTRIPGCSRWILRKRFISRSCVRLRRDIFRTGRSPGRCMRRCGGSIRRWLGTPCDGRAGAGGFAEAVGVGHTGTRASRLPCAGICGPPVGREGSVSLYRRRCIAKAQRL